jgi:MFS family permease
MATILAYVHLCAIIHAMMNVDVEVKALRHNRRFQALWIGSAVGFLGIEAADVGYPLAVLALTGSPATAGLFGVVQLVATLLAGLPAGAVADRYDRRRVLLVGEGVRAVSAASVAVALAASHLTVPHLLAVAAVLGAAGPFSGTARMLLVRAVVPAEHLTAALTTEQIRDGLSQLIGPPLGGLLYGLRQLLPFAASAIAFAVSWLATLVVRVPPRDEPATGPAGSPSVLAGLRTIWRNPTLRAATLLVALLNAVGAPVLLITIVALRAQQVAPGVIGVAVAGYAVGGLIGRHARRAAAPPFPARSAAHRRCADRGTAAVRARCAVGAVVGRRRAALRGTRRSGPVGAGGRADLPAGAGRAARPRHRRDVGPGRHRHARGHRVDRAAAGIPQPAGRDDRSGGHSRRGRRLCRHPSATPRRALAGSQQRLNG